MKHIRRLLSVVIALAIVSLGFVGLTTNKVVADGCPTNNASRFALMSAFDAELTLILKEIKTECQTVINGRLFTVGTLYGHEVVAFLSGGSMVNAAMTTQLALDNFNIERIIFSGIAGGVNPDLPIGTVVIPDQWAQYLEAFFSRENPDKSWMLSPFYQKALPEGGNYGMIFPQPLWIPHDSLGKPDAVDQLTWIKADTSMIEVARKVANSVELAKCNADDKCLDKQPFVKVGGNGVAGQAFVDNKDFRENYAWGVWKADSLDMESAAVAHVAYSNETPFIIFRSLSDLAGGGEGENEIALFFQVAADNSAKVFLAFVKAYVEQ